MAEAPKSRELDYVMVQNMGYSPETRVLRHVRPGQRKQRVTLENGRRIRDKGARYDEVSFTDLFKNFETLVSAVRTGAVQICRPDNLEPLTLEQLAEMGKRLAADYKTDLKVDETLFEPLLGSDLKDEKVWVEKPKAVAAEPAKEAAPEPPKNEVIPEGERVMRTEAPAPKPVEGTGLLDDQGKEAAPEVEKEPSEKKDTKKDKHSSKKDRR